MQRKNYTTWVLAVLVIVAIGATLAANISRETTQRDVLPENLPVAVQVSPATLASLQENITSVGTVSAMADVVVSAETAGRALSVPFKVGDNVHRGQILAVVDDELKVIAVEQAEAQLLAAQASHDKAQRDFERGEKLAASNGIAETDLEGLKLAKRAAEAQRKSAQVALKHTQRQLDDTRIKAPIRGQIAGKSIEAGEMVAPGHQIANIIDLSQVLVKISVPEDEISKVSPNQTGVVVLDAYPGVSVPSRIYSIGSKSETVNGHTYPVEMIVENPPCGVFKVGMFARVSIRTQNADNVLTIDREGVLSADDNPYVFLIADDKVIRRAVTLGLRSGERVQVRNGLAPGDLVVTFGQQSLKEGVAVKYELRANP